LREGLVFDGQLFILDEEQTKLVYQVIGETWYSWGTDVADGVLLIKKMDAEGNILASVSGPYSWCVHAPLAAGLHKVQVSFEKSSGEIVEFSWTFTLVDEPMLTPTPLS